MVKKKSEVFVYFEGAGIQSRQSESGVEIHSRELEYRSREWESGVGLGSWRRDSVLESGVVAGSRSFNRESLSGVRVGIGFGILGIGESESESESE